MPGEKDVKVSLLVTREEQVEKICGREAEAVTEAAGSTEHAMSKIRNANGGAAMDQERRQVQKGVQGWKVATELQVW